MKKDSLRAGRHPQSVSDSHKSLDGKDQESEERYRSLVEISPDAVMLLDLNGDIIMVNKAGVKLLKYETKEDVIGKRWFRSSSPTNRQQREIPFGK